MTDEDKAPTQANGDSFTISVDGKEYHAGRGVLTGGQIEDLAGIPREAGLIRVLEDGTQEQIGEEQEVELRAGDQFRTPPRFVRGAGDTTAERRQREMELLRKRYPRLEHGPGLDWFRVRELPLPQGWNRESTDVLVLVSLGYPATAPDNFFVTPGLRTARGAPPDNYWENQSVLGETWAQFSFHADGWAPTDDPATGDSLLVFMLQVERRLQEAN